MQQEQKGGHRTRRECLLILEAIGMGIDNRDLKFTRRMGDKMKGARPLCVGFYSESDRDKLLWRARDLEKTQYKNVSACPDLTWRQRKEEDDLRKEAARRNDTELTDDDRSKNLIWAMVGAKGHKRLVKTAARNQAERDQQQERMPWHRNEDDQRRGTRRPRSESEEASHRTGPAGKR